MESVASIEKRYSDSGRYFRGSYKPEGIEAIKTHGVMHPFFANALYRDYRPRNLLRYLCIAEVFPEPLTTEKVLDVGSRDRSLEEILKRPCSLVDKNNPNLPSWDWEKESLPYSENAFDTIVCLDTLEHINDFHASFQDLLRVSKKNVIISLPNCWRKMFKQMLKGRGDVASYGLPPEKPMDRHKWFMNTQEIEEFLAYQSAAGEHPYTIKKIVYHVQNTIPRHRIQYPLMKSLLPERYFKNLLVNNVFVWIEKK